MSDQTVTAPTMTGPHATAELAGRPRRRWIVSTIDGFNAACAFIPYALALLGIGVLLQLFVAPEALWTAHVYWASILVVLARRGPDIDRRAGKVSRPALRSGA